MQVQSLGRKRPVVDRRADRTVTMTAIAMALVFLCAAILATFLPVADRLGSWLPLHLAMAGAASTAIAGVMPFFSAAIAVAPPAPSAWRWIAVLAVAAGATGVSLGYAAGHRDIAAVAGVVYLSGLAAAAAATFQPMRRALGPRGGVVTFGYAAALTFVGIGAGLAIGLLLGVPAISEGWASLKPAHAWLNLVGFVSLVIATTLLHFFPTVVGARIKRTPVAYTAVAGLAIGAALVALAYALGMDWLGRIGALTTAAGAASLAAYAVLTWRARAAWSGDSGWHTFAMGGLVSAVAWFCLSIAIVSARLLSEGVDPAAARTDALVAPFVAGWMGLALLASATHLVPSVGPGGPQEHAAQRGSLGWAGGVRLIVANLGIALLALGYPFGVDIATALGAVCTAVALLATTIMIIIAIGRGAIDARRRGMLRA